MNRKCRAAIVLFVAVGCVLLLISGSAAGAMFQTSPNDGNPDRIVLSVHLTDDGVAEWTIEHRYRLADDNDTAAFEELQEDIEANEQAYIDRFRERMDGTVADAAESTGRAMELQHIAIETEMRSLPQDYGIVRYTYEWHGFVVEEDGQLMAGDAISGLFLDEQSDLRVSWNESYGAVSITPQPDVQDDTSAEWDGPRDFNENEPRIILNGDRSQTMPGGWLTGLLFMGLIVAVIAGTWWTYQRREAPTEPTPTPPTDASLLSNEERVLQLLADEGGRMRQQEVVEHLGWTDAKTSQVVSNLREEEKIESFRLGRENVLRIPDDQS